MSNLLKEHWQQDDINKTKGKYPPCFFCSSHKKYFSSVKKNISDFAVIFFLCSLGVYQIIEMAVGGLHRNSIPVPLVFATLL